MKALLGLLQIVLTVLAIIMFWGRPMWWSVSMLIVVTVEVTMAITIVIEEHKNDK